MLARLPESQQNHSRFFLSFFLSFVFSSKTSISFATMSLPNPDLFSPRHSNSISILMSRKGRLEGELADLEESKTNSIKKSTEFTEEREKVARLVATKTLQEQNLQDEIAILQENDQDLIFQQGREQKKIATYQADIRETQQQMEAVNRELENNHAPSQTEGESNDALTDLSNRFGTMTTKTGHNQDDDQSMGNFSDITEFQVPATDISILTSSIEDIRLHVAKKPEFGCIQNAEEVRRTKEQKPLIAILAWLKTNMFHLHPHAKALNITKDDLVRVTAGKTGNDRLEELKRRVLRALYTPASKFEDSEYLFRQGNSKDQSASARYCEQLVEIFRKFKDALAAYIRVDHAIIVLMEYLCSLI